MEKVYINALKMELVDKNLKVEQQVPTDVPGQAALSRQ
ncbi:MAG: hypothetical protein PHP51_06360 [Desulfotomaculaceae bacterium]|nr:hypothetical protein [Desulfotomaculaceae bacterium]MDD4767051.1 hypothetical protein [Desulfotomaculaceae bacterium]